MNTQFWKPITPVEGEPIPEGAMFLSEGCVPGWKSTWMLTFDSWACNRKWRVPREVVPLDVAVMLVRELLRTGFCGVFGVNPSELSCMEEFPELVTAKLREMSEVTNG